MMWVSGFFGDIDFRDSEFTRYRWGGMEGKLRMGRYLEYPKYMAEGHRTTGNLYLYLMQAAGMKTGATFGQPDANLKHLNLTGPLTELMT